MAKSVRRIRDRQALALGPRGPVQVQIPLRLLTALEDTQSAFFGLCMEAGRQVLGTWMEEDRAALCGPKDQQIPDREAVRAGSTQSSIVLGGRTIPVKRPRARSVEGRELSLPSFAWAAGRDPLDAHTMEAMALGVSTRKYRRSLTPLPRGERDGVISKSAVSRRFVALTQQQMERWLSQPLGTLNLAAVLIDGKHFRDHCFVIALGITSDGEKHVLGLREGTTENTRVVQALLSDLVERGLPTDRALFFGIDGAKALRKAIRDTFGSFGVVQRCQEHKRRNVLDHLPPVLQPSVERALRDAWGTKDAELAQRQLERLARSLEKEHPGAAASVREGLNETLTLQRLGIDPDDALYRALRTTNAIENVIGSVALYTRNVKRWRGGLMLQRWVSASLLEAQKHFHRIRGYRELHVLMQALKQIQEHEELGKEKRVA